MINSIFNMMLNFRRRLGAFARTRAYRAVCDASAGVQFLGTSSISNAQHVRHAIVVGADSVIGGELLVFAHGGSIRMGKWCFLGAQSRVWSAQRVDIGDRVLISHNVNIHDCDSHPMDPAARHQQFRAIATRGHPVQIDGIAAAPISIGDDVWIGFNVAILKGVSIGARSVIAAGSIVTNDVPPDCLVIGDQVRSLLR